MTIQVEDLGRQDYVPVWQAMREFTANRDHNSCDQIWLVEHPPVFTQGRGGRPEHLLDVGDIPVVQTDRGGQVTYHGPGQLVVYPLIDLKRRGLGVRRMVNMLEQAVVTLLAAHQIRAYARRDAPGVYVDDAKVASLGLRVRHGACYHGLSLNVAMDLSPFARINPCGYAGMTVTDMQALGIGDTFETIKQQLLSKLLDALNETNYDTDQRTETRR